MTLPVLDVPTAGRLPALLAEVDEIAGRVPAGGDLAAALDAAAVATLRLDGSPIERPMSLVDDLPPPPGTATGPARGGWLETLRSGAVGLDRAPDEVLMAVEHRGARTALAADDLAPRLRTELHEALPELHRRTTDGLLTPEVAGRPRRSEQSVHDASVGRVLFFPVEPDQVEARVGHLAAWLQDADAHPVVLSGVLHHQLLDVHPYEAANGRLARTAARLLLRAHGLDADGLAQPEAVLLDDAIGYLDDVARARRLRSPATFVLRWAEAVAAGLRAVAPPLPADEVPAATRRFLAERAGRGFTLGDHRDAAGGRGTDAALVAALDAGLAVRVLGTQGLHWRARGSHPNG